MQILVLGGTAWLGGQVVRAALSRGHDVTCLARGVSGVAPDGAVVVSADRDRRGGYEQVSGRSWDVVIDVSRQPGQVEGAVAALADRAAFFVFVSTGNVYADHRVPGANEDAATVAPLTVGVPATMENYGEAKVACEEHVRRGFGVDRSLIARVGLIGGPGDVFDRTGYWPLRFARAAARTPPEPAETSPELVGTPPELVGTPPEPAETPAEPAETPPELVEGPRRGRHPPVPGEHPSPTPTNHAPVLVPDAPELPTQVIDVRDLAAWLVEAGTRRRAGVLNASGETLALGEHLELARTVAGHHGPVVAAAESWLVDHGVQEWMGERSLPLWLSDPDWRGFNALDSSRARAAGLRTRPLRQTLADTLAWELIRPPGQERRAGLTDSDEQALLSELGRG